MRVMTGVQLPSRDQADAPAEPRGLLLTGSALTVALVAAALLFAMA